MQFILIARKYFNCVPFFISGGMRSLGNLFTFLIDFCQLKGASGFNASKLSRESPLLLSSYKKVRVVKLN